VNTHSRAKMTPSGGELLVKRVKDGLGVVFSAIRRALGDLPIVAEDLGTIDDEVGTLLRETYLIRAAFTSVADRAIVPLQHVARLGSEAWMNTLARRGT